MLTIDSILIRTAVERDKELVVEEEDCIKAMIRIKNKNKNQWSITCSDTMKIFKKRWYKAQHLLSKTRYKYTQYNQIRITIYTV